MGVGRFLCVALPFILTTCSLICFLIVTLAGVTNDGLYMFRVNMTELEFDPTKLDQVADIASDVSDIFKRSPSTGVEWHDPQLLTAKDTTSDAATGSGNGNNVTAADLSIHNLYDISLWGYCYTKADGDRKCSDTKFNWANHILNDTVQTFRTAAALAGQDVVLPDAIETAMKTFAVVTKWTEVAYLLSIGGLAISLFFGIFATCSRAFGCLTFILASIAAVLVCCAAALSTAMSVIIVGTAEATAKWYGVDSHFNTSFLAIAWMGAAFALGAAFFWMFTMCCCASNHTSSTKGGFMARSIGKNEKTPAATGTYQPLGGDSKRNTPTFFGAGAGNAPYGRTHQTNTAYEPYAHNSNV